MLAQGWMSYSDVRRLYQVVGCLTSVSYVQMNELGPLEVDRVMVNQARHELGVDMPLLAVPIYEAGDMPDNFRGQINPVRPRIYHIYLNPKSAGDDTVLHELYHLHQMLYGKIAGRSKDEIEEEAQAFAEKCLAEGKYNGILVRGD